VSLFKDGVFFAERSLTCGPKTFQMAVENWERKGFTVNILRQPERP
jgi:hypothetical protein